jgi:hypothetical protein
LWYVAIAGPLQLLLAIALALFFLLFARRVRLRASRRRLLAVYLVFNGFLLFWSSLGHYTFLCLTFEKLYVSADRLVDWFPFIPFGRWVLEKKLGPMHGHLLGSATLWQLRLIWLAIAAPVWLLAYVSTSLVFRGQSSSGLRALRASA